MECHQECVTVSKHVEWVLVCHQFLDVEYFATMKSVMGSSSAKWSPLAKCILTNTTAADADITYILLSTLLQMLMLMMMLLLIYCILCTAADADADIM